MRFRLGAISLGSLVKVSFRQKPQAFGTYETEATGVSASGTVKHATRVRKRIQTPE
jgi:hypothetical protein